jgi:alcohol dehydrogenase
VTLINTARIRPVVSNTYPLREIARAQADLSAGRYPGKLVLIPPEAET